MSLPEGTEFVSAPPGADPASPWEVDPASPWALAWPAGLFAIITFFVGADMAADLSVGIGFAHLGIESIALALCLAGAWGTGLQLRRALQRSRDLHRHLEGTQADLHRARAEAEAVRAGLGAALDKQFEAWGLTSAQREVALLVLKGLSYKEVADLRQTAEHTVRNQALAIFRKAGLAGRAEMAAYFIEDLLLPHSPASRPGASQQRSSGTGGFAA
jgi:DNA-binding CsgD family transcriptional regulator